MFQVVLCTNGDNSTYPIGFIVRIKRIIASQALKTALDTDMNAV